MMGNEGTWNRKDRMLVHPAKSSGADEGRDGLIEACGSGPGRSVLAPADQEGSEEYEAGTGPLDRQHHLGAEDDAERDGDDR